jgi:polyisoprenoid-binding protein YceI
MNQNLSTLAWCRRAYGSWIRTARPSASRSDHLKFTRVRGRFHEMTAVVRGGDDGNASITGSICVASVDTGDARRDARLRADDFFDVDHHPTISFTGEAPPAGSADQLTVKRDPGHP